MEKPIPLIELGFRLRRLRDERAMTQKEFAEACGFNQTQISSWEHGKNLPNLESIFVMSKNLGITVSDLLRQEEPEMAPPRKPDKYEMAIWLIQAIGVDGFKLDQVRKALLPPRL